jgi:glycerophosphoryl diester phosphodiesterase
VFDSRGGGGCGVAPRRRDDDRHVQADDRDVACLLRVRRGGAAGPARGAGRAARLDRGAGPAFRDGDPTRDLQRGDAAVSREPVQGFSGILPAGGGRFWAMPDNGYGLKENSADWLLRIYRIRPDFKTAAGGSGSASVDGFISLRDPLGRFPFPLVRQDRLLTGADIDPESIFQLADGTFWIGDEFGPWMLHFDAAGRLMQQPVPLPGVKSPQNPGLAPGETPTLGRSKGFEAAALASNQKHAYVFLEGPLLADPDQRRRLVEEFDVRTGRFTGRSWAYQAEDPISLVADAKTIAGGRLLVMERDDLEGAQAHLKRVYAIDLDKTDVQGFVAEREIVDLLDLADPDGVSLPAQPGDRGLGNPFSFPLRSVESILPLSGGRLMVANDNNYPFDAGRHPGQADGNEWIVVRPACWWRGGSALPASAAR